MEFKLWDGQVMLWEPDPFLNELFVLERPKRQLTWLRKSDELLAIIREVKQIDSGANAVHTQVPLIHGP